MRSFINGKGVFLTVDTSDAQKRINDLRGILTREQFEKLMYRTFREVANRSKTPIARATVQDYAVKQKWVRDHINGYSLQFGSTYPVTCTIPLSSHKGVIGSRKDTTFALRGAKTKKNSRVYAAIVKGHISQLPRVMKNQGGNAPFVGGGGRINGLVVTRRTKERYPVVRVVGLGVPQMPLNRSEEKVQNAIRDLLEKRLEHNFDHLMDNGWK